MKIKKPRQSMAHYKPAPLTGVPRTPDRRLFPKTLRNKLCWCGSGKKYKKCHYQKDKARGVV